MNRLLRFCLFCLLCFSLKCEAQIVFEDTFDEGKSGHWQERNDGASPGTFRLENGAYFLSSSEPLSLPRAIISGIRSNAYFIQADVTVRPLSAGYASAALLAYYRGKNHYYEFSVDANRQHWSLQKISKTGPDLLADGAVPSPGSSFRLGLYIQQRDIRAFIDGVMVVQHRDGQILPGGGFGLAARGAETQWDSVRVKISDPKDFFYHFIQKTSDKRGRVTIEQSSFAITDPAGTPIPNVQVYRIQRDAVSYFVFQDKAKNFNPKSGFLSEFRKTDSTYSVVLRQGTTTSSLRKLQRFEIDWMLNLSRKSARFVTEGLTATQEKTTGIFYRSGVFRIGNSAISDSLIANTNVAAELSGAIFGAWEDTGNYSLFPAVSGRIQSGSTLFSSIGGAVNIPPASKFTLVVLQLKATDAAQPTWISWLVQEDSRAFLVFQSQNLPDKIRAGGSYTGSFSIRNNGEQSGPFTVTYYLSSNSHLGDKDTLLAERNFSQLGAGGTAQGQVTLKIPADLKKGYYFIGGVIQPAERSTRLQSPQSRAVTTGDIPSAGTVEATLIWSGEADLDLHIIDPFGEHVYYFEPAAVTSGKLDQDGNCANSNQRERIVYPSSAVSGLYTVSVHYIQACQGSAEVSFTLEIRSSKGVSRHNGTLRPGQFAQIAQVRL